MSIQSDMENQVDSNDRVLAAVDLGSNSFHMVISRYQHGELAVQERQRETVRLASGLDDDGNLSEEVEQRALACLEKFAQLLRNVEKYNVRAVGTNALRRMRNSRSFLEKAEKALGHTIEIIAGREEARLIYLGVSKGLEVGAHKRLVVDIGGGSTEVIVGSGEKPSHRESLEVGCVVISQLYFRDGKLTHARFAQARLAAELAMQPVVDMFKQYGWQNAIGCSGTIKALSLILTNKGWAKNDVTSDGLQKLYEYVVSVGDIEQLNMEGLTDDRKPVFAGGLAVLMALFDLFEIHEMDVSDIALREGVLYDLIGRSVQKDTRDTAIEALSKRWSVDEKHALQVKQTALFLYSQIANEWDINYELYEKVLGWAAEIHEIGLLISHDGYNKHGAYVVQHADLAGFAKRDQLLLSVLIHGHRRKFPIERFESLPASLVTPAKRLAVILRLAVLLHRGRSSFLPKQCTAEANGTVIKLVFQKEWLEQHPLTQADMQQEKQWLKNIGISLKYK